MGTERATQVGVLRISETGRYFERAQVRQYTEGSDPAGKCQPFFWLGDTQWELFRLFSLEDVQRILDSRSRLGFTCLQIMLVGVDPLENVEGRRPWRDDNPLAPDGRYFEHVDKVIALCGQYRDLVLVIGVYHTVRMKGAIHAGNARAWARWVAARYKDVPGIVWSMYPRSRPEDVPICRELAGGLREGDGGAHLITAHPDPSPASSGELLHQEGWLAFNSIQTFRHVDLIYPMTTGDYRRAPAKPVVMAEGAYEGGPEYGFDVTPLWIRRQAYCSYLAGGHHSYGHNDSWRVPPTWQQALNAPGAVQLGILKRVFLAREEWWRLVPDQTLLAAGGQTEGQLLTLAARHPEGRWALIYADQPARFTVALDRLGAGPEYEGVWIDPRTGQSGTPRGYSAGGVETLATPDGWEDALLVLQAP